MKVLSLNAGSSTLKFGVFDFRSSEPEVVRGMLDRLGTNEATLSATESDGNRSRESVGAQSMSDAVRLILAKFGKVEAVGCRVVHGGEEFERPALVTDEVAASIQRISPLAPLHNPLDLDVIRTARAANPHLPVVAVFDTSFHRTLPAVAASYALPSSITRDLHVRRYGFHGISYAFIADQMALTKRGREGRLIACHLGSGSSVCAMLDGKSIETSMGMTPLEGLIMGTRCGDLDPGALLYIMRETGLSIDGADHLLNKESGLLALSNCSQDVREIEKSIAKGDANAEFALDAYSYRVAKYIGAYSVVLGGLDELVFSGGIGENSGEVRRRICGKLGSLGLRMPLGEPGTDVVSRISSELRPSVWVVRTDEERQIAVETMGALALV